jgi:hypothetical protein
MIFKHNQARTTHTTDGTNDYYVGINGVNGFSITDFQGLSACTIHMLINFPAIVNSATAQKILLEASDDARTNLWAAQLGAFTGLTTLEYIGVSRLLAGNNRALTIRDGGSISAGWHLVTFSSSAANTSVTIDGVTQSPTAFNGTITNFTAGFTATRLAFMAATSGAAPYGAEWRELSIYSDAWLSSAITDLHNYYLMNGNLTLGTSRRSVLDFLPKRPTLVEHYSGLVSGSTLKASLKSSHDLTLTNF